MSELDIAVREFLVESHENLDQLERDLVSIESEPRDREVADRVFRTVHSIKGACGFLAFSKLEAVAHAGEGLLSRLRDGELRWSPAIISALLALSDAMRKIMGRIEDDGSEGEEAYADLIERLVDLQTASGEPAAAAPPSPAASPPAPSAPILESMTGESASAGPSPAEGGGEEKGGPAASGISNGNVRVDVGLLDRLMNLVGELVLARNQILQQANAHDDATLLGTSQRLNLITTELQEGVMKTRMQPIGNVWNKFPRIVRDLAVACGKQVRVELEGSDTELDRTIIEAIKDPLTHVVRNAVDHGIEPTEERLRRGKKAAGCLRMRAFHESGQVNIEITDDGAGLDADRIARAALDRGLVSREQLARMGTREMIQLIFLQGLSTAEKVTNISGRGVGMDVVKTNIERIGGTIDIQSTRGEGTSLKIKIPLTLAIIPALIVKSGGDTFAIPQVNLLELVRLEREQAHRSVQVIRGAPILRLRGSLLPMIELNCLLDPDRNRSAQTCWQERLEGASVDFGALREKHLHWKTRLETLLDGSSPIAAAQLTSADDCDLGRWLNGTGRQRFGGDAEFADLDRLHRDMHRSVREVVEHHDAGRRDRALEALARVAEISSAMLPCLSRVEHMAMSETSVNIVVLQADGRRFGLVVDAINDTEEIVVKPLGKQLKGVPLFAGATIMGDGRVSLILDVDGISRRAGVSSGASARREVEEEAAGQARKEETTAFLLLRNGADGRVAIPLSLVARLEEIPCSSIELSGGHEVVQYRNEIIPLVRLAEALGGRARGAPADRDPMQVVVYTREGRSVGLVVDTILDIVEDAIQVRPARGGQRGLIGSAVIQQRVTDVVDVPGLVRAFAPDLALGAAGVGA